MNKSPETPQTPVNEDPTTSLTGNLPPTLGLDTGNMPDGTAWSAIETPTSAAESPFIPHAGFLPEVPRYERNEAQTDRDTRHLAAAAGTAFFVGASVLSAIYLAGPFAESDKRDSPFPDNSTEKLGSSPKFPYPIVELPTAEEGRVLTGSNEPSATVESQAGQPEFNVLGVTPAESPLTTTTQPSPSASETTSLPPTSEIAIGAEDPSLAEPAEPIVQAPIPIPIPRSGPVAEQPVIVVEEPVKPGEVVQPPEPIAEVPVAPIPVETDPSVDPSAAPTVLDNRPR